MASHSFQIIFPFIDLINTNCTALEAMPAITSNAQVNMEFSNILENIIVTKGNE